MTCKEALQREGTAALNRDSTVFSFSPIIQEPFTVFWDVTAITLYLAAREAPVPSFPLEGLKDWLKEGRVEIDRKHALSSQVDLRVPIIAIEFEDGRVPVDGWHRIYKAIHQGWKNIPTLVLDGEEEYRFRYPQALCDRLRDIADDPGYLLLEHMLKNALRHRGQVMVVGKNIHRVFPE